MLASLWLLLPALAQAAPPIGEAWVYAPPGEDRAALAESRVNFAESIDGDWVLVHGYAEDLDALETSGFSLRDRRLDHRLPPRPPFGEEGYHSAAEVIAELEDLAAAWPERAELIDLGASREGRPIVALRVGVAGEPAVRVIGGHHGDEPPSVEVALAVAEALLTEAPGFEGLVDSREVWILPLLNPDGLEAGSRYNAAAVDLNRNYDFQWRSTSVGAGEAPFSEPETRAARQLALLARPTTSLSLHTGAENVGYVYNYTTADTIEEARMAGLAEGYADACGRLGFEALQGADWYITRGDATDWAFGRMGTLDFTVELWREKAPDPAWLPELIDDHLPAIAAFLHHSPSLTLEVFTPGDLRSAPARFALSGDTMPAWSGVGAVHRVAEEGAQSLRIEVPGFEPVDVELELPRRASVVLAVSEELLEGARVEPTLLPWDTPDPALRLPGVDPLPEALTLSRAGFADVQLTLDGDAYPVDLQALAPGAWTLRSEAGVLPRGLLVGSDDAAVRLSGLTLGEDTLTLQGVGFGRGSRAWLLDDATRVPQAVPILSQDEGALVFDWRGLPREGTWDLLLWSNGRELAVADLLGDAQLDPGSLGAPAPPHLSLLRASTPAEPPSYASCSTPASGARQPWPALLLLLLRRRRCAPR